MAMLNNQRVTECIIPFHNNIPVVTWMCIPRFHGMSHEKNSRVKISSFRIDLLIGKLDHAMFLLEAFEADIPQPQAFVISPCHQGTKNSFPASFLAAMVPGGWMNH